MLFTKTNKQIIKIALKVRSPMHGQWRVLLSVLARGPLKVCADQSAFLWQPKQRVARATALRERACISRGESLLSVCHIQLVSEAVRSAHIPRAALSCSRVSAHFLGAALNCLCLRAGLCKMGVTMRGPCETPGENEDQKEEAIAAAECFAGMPEAGKDSEADSDSDLETEGIHGLREPVRDAPYLGSSQAHSIVPTIYFLHQGCAPELKLRHRGLGPQGARALASMLTSNLYIKRLDLRDNGLCGAGAEALADVLHKNSSICDVDLSENQLGVAGAQALCAALKVNKAVQKIQLAGNSLEEKAAQYLAELLLVHTGLKYLDVSYNQLNDQAGETLGPALAENTGLTELNISWNHLRGPGAIVFARGLEANIFLKVLDISFNGFGDSGASAVGEALKANNVLEELYMSNNRISAMGAQSLGSGLRVNQTLRILVVSRNPMQTEGCSHLLKSVRDNPASALELLDFSDMQVNREFDDLASSVKVIFPGLCIKTGAPRVDYKKELLPFFRPSPPASAPK